MSELTQEEVSSKIVQRVLTLTSLPETIPRLTILLLSCVLLSFPSFSFSLQQLDVCLSPSKCSECNAVQLRTTDLRFVVI